MFLQTHGVLNDRENDGKMEPYRHLRMPWANEPINAPDSKRTHY
jgi:hypothetical protein